MGGETGDRDLESSSGYLQECAKPSSPECGSNQRQFPVPVQHTQLNHCVLGPSLTSSQPSQLILADLLILCSFPYYILVLHSPTCTHIQRQTPTHLSHNKSLKPDCSEHWNFVLGRCVCFTLLPSYGQRTSVIISVRLWKVQPDLKQI